MANTYTQIYIHVVFSVMGRHNLIPESHKEALYKYITGIIRKKNHTLIAINGMSDHIHILVGMKPNTALSDLVRDIKNNSTGFINRKGWIRGRFNWQEGFGAFSYGHSQIDVVVKYIQNQEKHHARRTFRNEYLELLERFNVDYDTRHVFDEDE